MIFLLDKTQKDRWLPKMFDLLHDNMNAIAPSGLDYHREKQLWLEEVSPALDKAARQVLLYTNGDALIGFVQYYTRDRLLMVEEAQIGKEYQRSVAFLRLCRCLMNLLPADLERVEAYADRRNVKSIRLMERLGMAACEDTGCYFKFSGDAVSIRNRFCRPV